MQSRLPVPEVFVFGHVFALLSYEALIFLGEGIVHSQEAQF